MKYSTNIESCNQPNVYSYYSVNDNLSDLINNEDASDNKKLCQKYKSDATSVNSKKLPAIFGKTCSKWVDFKPHSFVLDYGGGKYDNVAKHLKHMNIECEIYDPYNRTVSHNKKVLQSIKHHKGADIVTCSNVLNVIKEDDIVQDVIAKCKRCLKSCGTVYFHIYEGDNTGIGKETNNGKSWQRNQKAKDYMKYIKKYFSDVTRHGKLIIAK